DGYKIQRDLYSAFLLMNSRLDLKETNREKCLETFENFVINHNDCIKDINRIYGKHPLSFGF
ncbi:MAG: hypothetical protein MJ244_03885, partial [Clostridia bacterium]|nr:hypothetical protein [Clostridia bacterium]